MIGYSFWNYNIIIKSLEFRDDIIMVKIDSSNANKSLMANCMGISNGKLMAHEIINVINVRLCTVNILLYEPWGLVICKQEWFKLKTWFVKYVDSEALI